ncbi:5-carboxymethyl-2-hydroxymuconate Delta-isomerase [Actinomycetota bacterium Odt1-20B]
MPHITVDYTATLDFDRRAFIEELHPMVREQSATRGVCKTLCRAVESHSDGPHACVAHVTIGLMPGRTEAVKARLADDALALLGKHITTPGTVTSAEVRDLPTSYRIHTP